MNVEVNGKAVGRIEEDDQEKKFVTEHGQESLDNEAGGFPIDEELFTPSGNSPNLKEDVDKVEVHYTNGDGDLEVHRATPERIENQAKKGRKNGRPHLFAKRHDFTEKQVGNFER